MKRFLLTTILPVIGTGCLLLSCKKQEMGLYSNNPSIYLTGNGDSVRYSFAIRPGTVLKDTIWLNARISGDSSSADRPVNLLVDAAGTTATPDVHYKLPAAIVPANKFTARIPVVVYRTADLQSKEVVLVLKLKDTEDFKTPFAKNNGFRILLNDVLTKPTNWESTLAIRFGTYSRVKYIFMIDVLGSDVILRITTSGILLNEMFYFKQKVINAWNDYVAANGPQKDENGLAIVFP